MLNKFFIAMFKHVKEPSLMIPAESVSILHPDHTLDYAFIYLNRVSYSEIPVVDAEGIFYGQVSLRGMFNGVCLLESEDGEDTPDIQLMSALPHYRVRQILIKPERYYYPDSTIAAIFKALFKHNYVCICDKNKRFLGIVTRKAVMERMMAVNNSAHLLLSADVINCDLDETFDDLEEEASYYGINIDGLSLAHFL